jgi:hypothetical protein
MPRVSIGTLTIDRKPACFAEDTGGVDGAVASRYDNHDLAKPTSTCLQQVSSQDLLLRDTVIWAVAKFDIQCSRITSSLCSGPCDSILQNNVLACWIDKPPFGQAIKLASKQAITKINIHSISSPNGSSHPVNKLQCVPKWLRIRILWCLCRGACAPFQSHSILSR